jgi:hypothetical protein
LGAFSGQSIGDGRYSNHSRQRVSEWSAGCSQRRAAMVSFVDLNALKITLPAVFFRPAELVYRQSHLAKASRLTQPLTSTETPVAWGGPA